MSVSPIGMAWWWFEREWACKECKANLARGGKWQNYPGAPWQGHPFWTCD